jgi:hypothetical protein
MMLVLLAITLSAPAIAVAQFGAGRDATRNQPVFIENRGQWDSEAKFLLRSLGLDLWITSNGVVYDLNRIEHTQVDQKADEYTVRRTPVFITYEGSSTKATVIGSGRRSDYYNYYIGSDPSKWAEHVPLYSGTRVQGLYSGIDAVFYLDNGVPRYDLVVAPDADPTSIRMKVGGQRS